MQQAAAPAACMPPLDLVFDRPAPHWHAAPQALPAALQGPDGGFDAAAAREQLQLTASQLEALKQALTSLGVPVPPRVSC